MSVVSTLVEQVTDTAKAIRVLQKAGAIDLRKPGQVIEASKNAKTLGPPAAIVTHAVKEYPDDPAVADLHGTVTFGELAAHSKALANALLDAGLTPGSVVGVIARDHRGLLTAMAAAGFAGFRLAMLNTGFGAAQFAEVAARERIETILYDEEFTDLVAELPDTPKILIWDDDERPLPAGTRTLDDIIASGRTDTPPVPAKYGGMVILTSGTTGLPKGARRDKFSPFVSALILDRIPIPQHGSAVIVSPVFHSTGFALWGVAAALGNKAVLLGRFDAEKTLAALAEHRAEMLVAVPTMLHRMLALGPDVIGKYDLLALKVIVIAGSALSPTLSDSIQDTFGDVLYNLYGSTEVGVAAVAQPHELRQAPGTAGRAPVSSHLALFDDDDRRITKKNVRGRLFVRTGSPFEGYTDGRSKQMIDGFMSSGDMARFDENGLMFIEGRDDDMIVSGGENVFPLEVENLLAEHRDVADVAVVGVDDEEYGTRLRAFIVRADGSDPQADELRAHVKANLARYKVPRDVVFVEELPRNPTGKLIRRKLPTGPLTE